MKSLFPLIGIIFLIVSCCNTKKAVYQEDEFQIFFGNSGGFTNAKMEYVINGDRNVFKLEQDTAMFVKKISKGEMKEIRTLFLESDFGNLVLNNPGNMTNFIEIKSSEYNNKVNWSGNENEMIADIYKQLLTILKTEK